MIPQPIPPIPEAPPTLLLQIPKPKLKKRGVSTTNLIGRPSQQPIKIKQEEQSTSSPNHNKQSTAPTSSSSSSSSSSHLLKGLWQRCVADCYCISNKNSNTNSNSNTTAINPDEEPEELDCYYYQFLPSCAEEEVLANIVPKLCAQLQKGSSNPPKAKYAALLHLAQLCDRDRAQNRIELVCSAQKYDVVSVLCQHILQDPLVTHQNYRQALLILSNLTLPMENKAVLLLGSPDDRDILLHTLHQGLTMDRGQLQLEVHLVCAILYNLSFLQDAKSCLCNFGGSLDHPKSLLRTLERLVINFQPFVAPQGSVASIPAPIATATVERQALRWIFGFVRNLCQGNDNSAAIDNAGIIGQTLIPKVALECIGYSAILCTTTTEAIGKWRAQSMEDLALSLLVELALREEESDPLLRCAVLAPGLHELNCQHYLQPLLQIGGIHGMRANAIVNRFDVANRMPNPQYQNLKQKSFSFSSSNNKTHNNKSNNTANTSTDDVAVINKRDDSPAGERQQSPGRQSGGGRSPLKRKPKIATV